MRTISVSTCLLSAALAASSALFCASRSRADSAESGARHAAQATFRAALGAFGRDRDPIAASNGLIRAINQDPTYAPPRYDLAMLEESENKWDDAILQFQEVRKLEGDSTLGLLAAKGIVRVKQIKALWATPDGRRKVEYDRALSRARALLTAGAVDDALSEASGAIQADATRYEGHCVAADALNKQGRYSEGAAHIREAMRLAPQGLQAHLQQALQEIQANASFDAEVRAADQALADKNYAAAGSHYLAAWKVQPTREATGLRGAIMLALAERLDESKAVLEKLVASPDPRVVREAAAQLKTLETFQRQQVLAAEAEASAARMRQAAAPVERHEALAAQGAPPSPVVLDPSNAERYLAMGNALAKEEKWDQAAVAFMEAARLDPSDASAHVLAGGALVQQRKWAEAIEQFGLAIKLKPNKAEYHDGLGKALFLSGDADKAIAEFKEAARLDPSNSTYQTHLQQAGG